MFLSCARSRARVSRSRDLTVPKGSPVSRAMTPCDLSSKKRHLQQLRLLFRQRGHGFPDKLVSLCSGYRLVGRFTWVAHQRGIIEVDLRPALSPQRIDALVARDREDPGAQARLPMVELVSAAPNGQHYLLRKLLRVGAVNPQPHEIRLHPRSVVLE